AASTVQVLVYRRGLDEWPEEEPAAEGAPEDPAAVAEHRPRRFDPRVVALCAMLTFGVLLLSTAWVLLGAVAVWLLVAWLVCRPDPEPLKPGLVLALAL